jgi:phosphate transport system protein
MRWSERDSRNAERVVANDEAIDALEHEVSHDVMRLLALRHPMARDLREVMAALRIASDIERIGDYAANVAKRSIALNLTAPVSPASRLAALAAMAADMTREVLEAYRARDADRARAVRDRDAELDDRYTALFRELLTYMMEEPRTITSCTHLLFMAKNLERIGDHATNIAENIWFLVHGEYLAAMRDKRDLTTRAKRGTSITSTCASPNQCCPATQRRARARSDSSSGAAQGKGCSA